jgi:hypothetical protein
MSRPLLVYGDDFHHYIAKFGRPYDLLNEMIAAVFCGLWGIRVPSPALFRLLPEHIPERHDKRQFEQLGFGSKYLEHAQELTNLISTWQQNQYDLGRIVNKVDLLRIGLFDLWLANEDRNHNNANLLIQPEHDGFYLVAIDHVNIFNTNSLHLGVHQLTEEDSILVSPHIPLFFKNDEKLLAAVSALENQFPGAVNECYECLPSLLQEMPAEWGIDIAQQKLQMEPIFSADWIAETIRNFRLYIARNFS